MRRITLAHQVAVAPSAPALTILVDPPLWHHIVRVNARLHQCRPSAYPRLAQPGTDINLRFLLAAESIDNIVRLPGEPLDPLSEVTHDTFPHIGRSVQLSEIKIVCRTTSLLVVKAVKTHVGLLHLFRSIIKRRDRMLHRRDRHHHLRGEHRPIDAFDTFGNDLELSGHNKLRLVLIYFLCYLFIIYESIGLKLIRSLTRAFI